MKRSDKTVRDRLLVENYIMQKSLGRSGIVRVLARAFSLTPAYIYKLIEEYRSQHPEIWEQLHIQNAQLHAERLGISNAITTEQRPTRGWWKRLLNKLS